MIANTHTNVLIEATSAKRWDVRANDHRKTLLGTFYDETSRDLFVEAVNSLCLTYEDQAALEPVATELQPAA